MKLGNHTARLSILCLLGGCAGASGSDLDVSPTALIEGEVSGTFPTPEPDCKPFGVPITAFLTTAFGLDDLVDDSATPRADGGCVHTQVLAAPADAWATLAYNVLCQGGGDIRLCGATATRRCSVDLLMKWAEPRSQPLAERDAIFGFEYVVQAQDAPSRIALQHRARHEVRILLDEAAAVVRQHAAGARDCPNEDREVIGATLREGADMERQLDELLSAVSEDA